MARLTKQSQPCLLAPVETQSGDRLLIGRTTQTIEAGTLLAFSEDAHGRPILVPVPDETNQTRTDWMRQFKKLDFNSESAQLTTTGPTNEA